MKLPNDMTPGMEADPQPERGLAQKEQLARHVERQALLLDVSRSLMEAGRDEALLARKVFEKVSPALDADVCFNYRVEAQGTGLRLVAGFGIPEEMRTGTSRLTPHPAFCSRVASTRMPLAVDGRGIPEDELGAFMHAMGVRAYSGHPLLDGKGQLLGTFSLASTRRDRFLQDELDFLQTLSHFLALAWERIRSERELLRREEQHRLALEAGKLGTWRRDIETDEFWMDARAQAHFGFEVAIIPSALQISRVHPEDRSRLDVEVATVNAAQPGKQIHGIEYRVFHPDGSERWLSVEAKVFREETDSGPRRVCIGTSADITDRKRIEQALQQAAVDMNRAQRMAKVGSWRLDIRRDVLEWSEEVYRIFDIPQGAALDYARFLATVHPEDRTLVDERWQAAMAGKEIYDVEHRIRVGQEVKWVREKAELEFDEQGKLAAGFGTVQDISDRKHAELALRESEQRYAALFSNRTNAIGQHRIVCDADGQPIDYVVEAVNEAYERMIRIPRERIEGRLITEIIPDVRSLEFDFIGHFGRIALGGGEGSFEVYLQPFQQWLSIYAYSPKRGEVIALFSDVTQQKRIEMALRESEENLRATFEQAAVGIVHVGPEGRFLRVNRKFSEMLDYTVEELRRMHFAEVAHEPDREIGMAEFRRSVAGELPSFTIEKRYQHRNGSLLWVRITSSTVRSQETGAFRYNIAIIEDITQNKEAEQRARDAALHDPLTGLPNRRLVFEYAVHLLAAAARKHSQGAFLFIDLDRFKPVNDLYGHEVGDRLLQEVGRRLLDCVRHEDVVGRLGGDEFVIMLPHLEAPPHAATVARHVIESVSRPFQLRELDVSISSSIGISLFPQHGLDVDTLIHAADLAMYQAKQCGPGNHHVYTPELERRTGQASSVEARLKQALRRNGLLLHYQPVIDMKSGRPSGAEALLRLAGEDGLTLSPDRFIPVAEAAGLIAQIGEWVAGEACRQHAAWRAEGLPSIPIAINVSPLQFRQRAFAQRLLDIVLGSGIDPACFQIEVTESTVMENVAEAIETLQRIKSVGIKVALDDFGTGYSSLSHLSTLPLDKLKVDQSFVKRIEHEQASRAITEAIIALGRTLNLEVVGEGIESQQVLSYLRHQGCDHGQGFLFSPALPEREFANWYRQHTAQAHPPE